MKGIIEGKIQTIFQTEAVGNFFEKRLFWLEEINATKPQTWQLELQQGECSVLDKFKEGDVVSCNVEVRGNRFTTKAGGREFVANVLKCTMIKKLK